MTACPFRTFYYRSHIIQVFQTLKNKKEICSDSLIKIPDERYHHYLSQLNLSMKKAKRPTILDLNRDFNLSPIQIGPIIPESDRSGRTVIFYPSDRFSNKQGIGLHQWGEGPFCRFRIPEKFRKHTGIYFFTIQGEIVFVGWCQDLARRINQHYGTISPRRCYEGGEMENCFINQSILDVIDNNESILLYFIPDGSEEKAHEIIDRLSPVWNLEYTQSIE